MTWAELDRESMIRAVSIGKDGSAMMAFQGILDDVEIEAVVDFIRDEFMGGNAVNTRYHTAANGWPNHERFAAAFPFVLGALALDTPWETLSAAQQVGRRLFMDSCITCHDRASLEDTGRIWNRRSISFPRGGYDHVAGNADTISAATPFGVHDIAPKIEGLTDVQRRGEALFQSNCAFCHGADGTGKNWIGSFLQPHPRDLTDDGVKKRMTRQRLRSVIADGLPGTTMSAWKNVLSAQQIDDLVSYIDRVFIHAQQGVSVDQQK